MGKGNIVNWEEARFELTNMTEIEATEESICVPVKPGHVLMPNLRNFTHHKGLCEKFRGQVSVVDNQATQDELGDVVNQHDSCSTFDITKKFWNGWWDVPEEGNFTNVNNGQDVGEFQPWSLGEPNGINLENCGVTWIDTDNWNDAGCESMICGFCEMERSPDIVLRGCSIKKNIIAIIIPMRLHKWLNFFKQECALTRPLIQSIAGLVI